MLFSVVTNNFNKKLDKCEIIAYNVVMHLVINKSKHKGGKKIYESVLLRTSYRENGKVKKKTIANISGCTQEEIRAISLALKHKDDLSALKAVKASVELKEGLSVGAVWAVYQTAKALKIPEALGGGHEGKLALWQVIARVLEQGSRLSAVRLAQTHAACDILGIKTGFSENDLYGNLDWLSNNQSLIEDKLYSYRSTGSPEIYLYDVTSSYLEGEENYFGAYGYNRDGKKNKKQIVIGLLCDGNGEPVSIEVFRGNTTDVKTFASQVKKAAERFGCTRVTFVGDRGMIKSAQIEELPEGFHYITAITKPQIERLIKKGLIQLSMFENKLCEAEEGGVRYILRRNPVRAEEIAEGRQSKVAALMKLIDNKNLYLKEHAKAKAEKALEAVNAKLKRLKTEDWLKAELEGRRIKLTIDEQELNLEMLLDGCYVIKTDLPIEVADSKKVHDRYKDLTKVEQAFRTCKTVQLDMRPIYVRKEASTRGHAFVVMLAYLIIMKLSQAWGEFDLTVEEGLRQLTTLCSTEVIIDGKVSCIQIPEPRDKSKELLKALNIIMPKALPHRHISVDTKRKLQSRRKLV